MGAVAFRQQLPAAVDDFGVGVGVGLCLAGTFEAKQCHADASTGILAVAGQKMGDAQPSVVESPS